LTLLAVIVPLTAVAQVAPDPAWLKEFPETNFKKTSIDFDEFVTDGSNSFQVRASTSRDGEGAQQVWFF
jgi:hypothetical protein